MEVGGGAEGEKKAAVGEASKDGLGLWMWAWVGAGDWSNGGSRFRSPEACSMSAPDILHASDGGRSDDRGGLV